MLQSFHSLNTCCISGSRKRRGVWFSNDHELIGMGPLYEFDSRIIFSALSPVWTLESCDLEMGINLDGCCRQLRQSRRSTDINVVFKAPGPSNLKRFWSMEERDGEG